MRHLLTIPALLLAAPIATGTSIFEDWKSSLVLNYQSGDSLTVACEDKEQNCQVQIVVDSRSFSFTSIDLSGLTIVADRANLYSVQGGERSSNFAFNVSVICPNESSQDCMAEASVVDGRIGPVTVSFIPPGSTKNHGLAPNKSFKPNPLRGSA